MTAVLQPGQRLARGVVRHLRSHGLSCLTEFVPDRGLRVDVVAVDGGGEIWVVECKSSRADFNADSKWWNYLPWCDRFFWAVDRDFPLDLLPDETGILIADDYDAEILREAPQTKLAAARRKALTLKIARTAMMRLTAAEDPRPARRQFGATDAQWDEAKP